MMKLIELKPRELFKLPGEVEIFRVLVKYSKTRITVREVKTGDIKEFSGDTSVIPENS